MNKDENLEIITKILNKEIDRLEEENKRLNNIIEKLKDDSRILKEFSAWIVNRHEPDLFHKMEIVNKLIELKEGK